MLFSRLVLRCYSALVFVSNSSISLLLAILSSPPSSRTTNQLSIHTHNCCYNVDTSIVFVNHSQRDTRHDSRCSKSCIIANSYAFRFHIEKCALCYDLTHSTPGFAADPNNCAQFYMCELIGDHWNASLMVCPNCTFWNQEILSCETVDPSCYKSVSIFTNTVTGTGAYYILLILLFTGQTSIGRLFFITKDDDLITISVICSN